MLGKQRRIRDDKIMDYFKHGENPRHIAKRFKMTSAQIYYILRRDGIVFEDKHPGIRYERTASP